MVQPTPLRTAAEDTLLARYPAERGTLPGDAAVATARDAAFARFAAAGLPHRRVEAWRYTDLRAGLRAIAPAAPPAAAERLSGLVPAVPGDGARRLVLANGRLDRNLSDLAGLPDGVTVTSLAEALAAGRADLLAIDAGVPEARDNVALALNAAFASDGVVIALADGVRLEQPFEIAHVTDGEGAVSVAVRNVVTLGAGASLMLIETMEATSSLAHQTNVVTAVRLGAEAECDHIRLQLEPEAAVSLSSLVVEIAGGARFESFHAALGAGLARAQAFARFTGRGASGAFRGASLLSGRRVGDQTLVVVHDAEACDSRELFKAVIDEEARSVFQGRIVVPAHAQKTDARMMTASLLLSESAEANAKPELEIFADDVQCGHGATCGALDEGMLFYMLARGIARTDAEALMIQAFLGETIDEVHSEAVRDMLTGRIAAWLSARKG